MQIKSEDRAKFQKLHISSLLELALCIPHSYEDLRLRDSLHIGEKQLIDATVNSVVRTPNSLKIVLFAHNLSCPLEALIFRPKPYMLHQFTVDGRYFLYGTIEKKNGHLVMAHPKRVTTIGNVMPRYRSILRNDVMIRLIQKYLTRENLLGEGLKTPLVQMMLDIHFPKDKNICQPKIGFEKEYIDAFKYVELFHTLKQLASKRRYFPSKKRLTGSYQEWQVNLPFTLTDEQLFTMRDIQEDLAKEIAARRMIVGDVGSGKTVVMFAAVVMAQGHKSVLMAPTTLLADQLYVEAKRLLPQIKTALVTNKTSKLALDRYDFIIGTHALLYRELPDISLVMIDEQHRFGTAQRNLLSKIVSNGEKKAHLLQFSATPIPRTQAMIQSAHIDVSLITTTPFKKEITTQVIRKAGFSALLEHIKREVALEHQVLLVYPLVSKSEILEYQSIDEAKEYWQSRFKNVYYTHGKDREKEKVLLDFREKGDILLATTVVEVGISLPRLSTVVVVGAERLGLSTLHQLRGRVSRTGLQGYCYLFTYQENSDRLEQFCKTQSGFDIAELDLKFRKSGDLLKGINQSGSEFKWVDMSEDIQVIQEVKKDLKIL